MINMHCIRSNIDHACGESRRINCYCELEIICTVSILSCIFKKKNAILQNTLDLKSKIYK